MIHTIHRLREFLRYQQRAQTKYYIHSPFVYQFYLNVLEGHHSGKSIQHIQSLRKRLLQNYDKIRIDDMGASPGIKEKTISHIAAKASIPHKYGMVLHNLVHYFLPHTIIEIGTCLGLGTAYLASGNPSASVITIEGSTILAEHAKQNFNEMSLKNIVQVTGNFDEKLPEVLTKLSSIGLGFIDGNHRYEPTLRYFNQLMEKADDKTILIFDDIYWSAEMTEAWRMIKLDPRISLTIDIYRFGIAFIQKDKLAKENFILRY